MSKNKAFTIYIIAFLAGLFIASYFPYDDRIFFVTFLLLFSLFFIYRNNSIVKVATFSGIFLIFGIWHFYNFMPEIGKNHISFFNNKNVEIQGFIASYPQEKDTSKTFFIQVAKARLDKEWQDVNGKVYVMTSELKELEYGKNIKIEGLLQGIGDSEESSLAGFFASKGAYSMIIYPVVGEQNGYSGNIFYRYLFKLKNAFENKVEQVFIEPFSSMILGIMLGVKKMPKEIMDIFNLVAISHIIVISGYNISIVADFFKKIFNGFSRKLSFWIPLFAIIIFTLFVGAEPPVLRAAIMASILLFAKKEGRKANGVFMVLFAAFVMSIANPLLIRFDPSFQLSVLSTLGLVLISDKLLGYFKKVKIPHIISEALASTLAAQLFIIPIIILYFNRLSIVSPVVNILVLPIVPLIMFSTFVITLIGFIDIGVARLLSYLSSLMVSYIISLSIFFSRFKYASISIKTPTIFIYLYYLLLALPLIFKKIILSKIKNEKATAIN